MFARLFLWLALPIGMVLLFAAQDAALIAQSPATEDPPPTAEIPPAEKTPAENTPAEKTQAVYIPYDKLREVFEKEGRGVFLPHGEFQKLWDAAHAKPTPPNEAPPVDALITEIDSQAYIEQDVVRVSAKLSIELLKKGWLQVPLRLSDVALQSATIDGKPARVTPAAGGGYQLLIRHEAAQPRTIELKLQYARAFTKNPGQNSVAFDAPTAPVNRWRIRIAQSGVKINVQPHIAATEVPSDDTQPDAEPKPDEPKPDESKKSDETVVLAFVGAAPQVVIDWTPKAEGATGLTALATVEATQELFLNENTIRTRMAMRYDISRATLGQLNIDVPADYKVVNVFDANVRKWDVKAQDGQQRITVELFEAAKTTQNISIELEKLIDEPSLQQLHAPVVRAIDVGRQQGIIVVNVDLALRAEVTTRSGLLQLDAVELPQPLAAQPWTLAYRYAALPFDLALNAVKVKPRITVEQFVEAYLEPDMLAMDVLAVFDIAEAGVFQLEFNLPPSVTVREVLGANYPGAVPANVDSHQPAAGDAKHLIVNLRNKAIGKVALSLRLEQRLSDANLLAPTGTAATIPLVVPQARHEFLSRSTGRLLLSTPESLRINPQTTNGLRPISLSEANAGLQSLRGGRFPNSQLALAFAFSDQAADSSLSVERRKPFITAKQRLLVSVDSGVVRFESQIMFDILYSGVNNLRIDVPAELAAEIVNESSTIRETAITPAPADVAEGYVAWQLTGQSEMLGRQVVTLSWEQNLEELAIGKSMELIVPQIKPQQLDRAWGQIVVTKSEALDVQPVGDLVGLRPVDPQQDVMPEGRVSNAARAFEFQSDWALKLSVTRYKLEDIKHTSIERALVRMVLTRSGQVGVQAMLRLRSAQQRLTLQLPEGAQYDSQPVRINGSPVSLERGDKDEVFVPLAGHNPDQSLLLELRYSLPSNNGRMDLPHFPEDPAMQRVVLNVFMPKELSLIGWTGPWAEEWSLMHTDMLTWTPVNLHTDQESESWVTEGLAIAPSPAFQRDGTLYSFTSLKPQAPPIGSLKLVTANNTILIGALLLLLAGVALLLLRSPLRFKVIATATVCLLFILIGVFAPTLAAQIFSLPVLTGLTATLILWAGWYGYRSAAHWESKPKFEPADPTPIPTVVLDADRSADPESNEQGGDQHV